MIICDIIVRLFCKVSEKEGGIFFHCLVFKSQAEWKNLQMSFVSTLSQHFSSEEEEEEVV